MQSGWEPHVPAREPPHVSAPAAPFPGQPRSSCACDILSLVSSRSLCGHRRENKAPTVLGTALGRRQCGGPSPTRGSPPPCPRQGPGPVPKHQEPHKGPAMSPIPLPWGLQWGGVCRPRLPSLTPSPLPCTWGGTRYTLGSQAGARHRAFCPACVSLRPAWLQGRSLRGLRPLPGQSPVPIPPPRERRKGPEPHRPGALHLGPGPPPAPWHVFMVQ